MSGVRASAVVLAGVAAMNAGNYLFHVIAARELGPARYGDLATLVILSGLISLPLGGVQVWVARRVAEYESTDNRDAVHRFVRRAGVVLTATGSMVTMLLFALVFPIQHALGIASVAAVALTAMTAFPAIVSPLTWGLAQGLQRFTLVAVIYASGPVARIGLMVIAFSVGLHVGGAMLATLASMGIALILPLWVLRSWFTPATGVGGGSIEVARTIRSLLPVMGGLLAITALTGVDVVVAKVALTEHQAGIYGSASLVGRVILYLPAAIITVLLPRVAARTAKKEESLDILSKSVAATALFGAFGILAYSIAGPTIIRLAFGAKYAAAGPLLWRFAIAMGGYAILNVLLIYHLGRDQSAMSWLLTGGAVAQAAAFLFIHDSARELIAVDVVFAVMLLIGHEVIFGGMLSRSLGTLLRDVVRDRPVTRAYAIRSLLRHVGKRG
jgi:O-antigen/teichoic acid export membrane protein